MTSPSRPVLADLPAGQLAEKLGIEIVDWNPDRLVATMPVKGNVQPYGLLHGGASCALAETVASTAAALHAGLDRSAVGLELNATHHRAATDGIVTAVCAPAHRGRTVATFEVVITDERDRRICTVRMSCLLIDRPPAGGRPLRPPSS